MRTNLFKTLAAGALSAALLAPAASAQVLPGSPDNVTSDNVEHIGSFKLLGDGVGARVIGNMLYATSTTGLFIFDITNPESPQLQGTFTADVEWENEDVPTNGKILGISGSTSASCNPGSEACLNIYDVSDPSSVSKLGSVDVGAHTMECVLDCTWFYGSEGQIVDARDPANPKLSEFDWAEQAIEQGYDVTQVPANPHDAAEIAPGYVVSASQPMVLMSLHPQDGGSPEHPVVIASGNNEDKRLMHSIIWPRTGKDRFMLVGGETVLGPVGGGGPCDDEKAAFMTWRTDGVRDGKGGFLKGGTWSLIDEVRPYNGNYTDGGHPVDAFGCSVHWFDEHPTFRNGGLVAVSAYEHGTRLYDIAPDGKITEVDYALPIAGATSAPHWAADGKVFYTLDYQRGMDIWRYTGTPSQGPADDGQGGDKPADPPAAALELDFRARNTKARTLARNGYSLRVKCSRGCDLQAALSADRKTAKKLKLKGRSLGKATRRAAEGATTLRIKLSKAAARRISRARGIKLRLTITAKSADGRSARAVKTIRVT